MIEEKRANYFRFHIPSCIELQKKSICNHILLLILNFFLSWHYNTKHWRLFKICNDREKKIQLLLIQICKPEGVILIFRRGFSWLAQQNNCGTAEIILFDITIIFPLLHLGASKQKKVLLKLKLWVRELLLRPLQSFSIACSMLFFISIPLFF